MNARDLALEFLRDMASDSGHTEADVQQQLPEAETWIAQKLRNTPAVDQAYLAQDFFDWYVLSR